MPFHNARVPSHGQIVKGKTDKARIDPYTLIYSKFTIIRLSFATKTAPTLQF